MNKSTESNKESVECDESTSGGSDKIMTHTQILNKSSKSKYRNWSNSSQTSFNSETYSGSRSNGHVKHDEGQHLGYGLDGGQAHGGFGHWHGSRLNGWATSRIVSWDSMVALFDVLQK